MIRTTVEFKREGEVHTPLNLYAAAWDECVELGVMDKLAWVLRVGRIVQNTPRFEVLVYDDELCVGGVVIAEDDDLHVGHCLSVMFNYVLPEYRCTGITAQTMRALRRIAENLQVPTIAYTHRVGAGKYTTTYKEAPWVRQSARCLEVATKPPRKQQRLKPEQ